MFNLREKKLVTRAIGDAACVTRSPRLTQEENVILLAIKRQIRVIFVLFCNASRRPISNVKLFMYWTRYLFRSVQVRRLIQTSNFRTQLVFTVYNGLQCLPVKLNYSNFCFRFGTVRRLKLSRSIVEILLWATRSDGKRRSYLFLYWVEGIGFDTWRVRRLHWA